MVDLLLELIEIVTAAEIFSNAIAVCQVNNALAWFTQIHTGNNFITWAIFIFTQERWLTVDSTSTNCGYEPQFVAVFGVIVVHIL
jgi:hypothetical protein